MVSPDLLNKVQPTEPKEWLIRDVQDGYERCAVSQLLNPAEYSHRTTQHMQITKFTMSGLREGISNKWVLNKELFTSICAVLSDVWQREPALFLVVVLSSCADAAYVAMQTYFEAQMVMIVRPQPNLRSRGIIDRSHTDASIYRAWEPANAICFDVSAVLVCRSSSQKGMPLRESPKAVLKIF